MLLLKLNVMTTKGGRRGRGGRENGRGGKRGRGREYLGCKVALG
jgi:hypothetical protein